MWGYSDGRALPGVPSRAIEGEGGLDQGVVERPRERRDLGSPEGPAKEVLARGLDDRAVGQGPLDHGLDRLARRQGHRVGDAGTRGHLDEAVPGRIPGGEGPADEALFGDRVREDLADLRGRERAPVDDVHVDDRELVEGKAELAPQAAEQPPRAAVGKAGTRCNLNPHGAETTRPRRRCTSAQAAYWTRMVRFATFVS